MIRSVALRSPIVFRPPGPFTANWQTAELEAVAIPFEQWEFIWHPPMKRQLDDAPPEDYGPMVSVAMPGNDGSPEIDAALLRFLSAVAFRYHQPVEDESWGAAGGADPWNPHGSRAQRAFGAIHLIDAPKEIAVLHDESLWLALALYREGINATSPIYGCLCFRNVLDVAFDVRDEKSRQGVPTPEAAARDVFINARAGQFAGWYQVVEPAAGWADYFRDEIRNAAAHVIRNEGKRVLNPDRPRERLLLQTDARILAELASEAVGERWQDAVVATRVW